MKRTSTALLGLCAFMSLSASISAQTLSVGTASGPPGGATTPAQIPVTFTRNASAPVADFTARVTYNTTNFDATAAGANGGSCAVNDPSGFVTVLPPPGSSDVATNIYCNITFTIAAGVAAASYPLALTTTFPGGGCFDSNANTVVCTLSPGSITVTGAATGPGLTYNPAAGASAGTGGPVNFTGVTTPGTTGSGTISATPSGGSGGGTTTLGSFSFTGANPGAFTVTSGATLTFTAGVNTAQNITMTCTSTAAAQTANLQATETITGGATSTRFWVVNCPAGVAGAVGPSLTYNPAAGASAGTGGPVNFTGVTTVGSTGNGTISATPSGGSGGGTTTLSAFSFTGANPGAFTRTSGATLTFTAGVNTAQNITMTCVSTAAAQTANLQATETITGGATSTRFWVVNCPAGAAAPVGPSITYNPAAGASAGTGGPVNFTGVTTPGTIGNGTISATPSGGSGGGTTTVGSFSFTGANPGAFAVTSGATLTFTAGVNTAQNITMTCTSTAAAQTANLQATETITGGATSTRFWVVNCPAGAAVPVGPSLTYNPAAGASAGTGGPVNFTGVTTPGTIGNGTISATPSGGAGGGTTTLSAFSFTGANAGAFTRTSGATLTFTAGVNTAQNITMTCTSTAAAQTANLQATETITGGATSTRFWVVNCPAGVAGAVGPSITYNPAAGASAGTGGPVNFTGVTTPGTIGNGTISATPSGGSGGGTTTVGSFSFTGANAGAFAVSSAATLTFTAGVNTAQNITMTCTSTAAAQTANLQATETITGGATSTRFWVVNCPAGVVAPVGPSLTYNPAAGASAGTGGPVNFTGVTTPGSTGNGTISATPSGGAGGGTTTLTAFSFTGANAAAFTRTSGATLTFTAGVNTAQNITMTCASTGAAQTANLQATETIQGGATSTRFWVVNCPAGANPLGPDIAYNPAAGASAGTGGPVNFTGVGAIGSQGTGLISATPSGGAAAGTTTINGCSFSGGAAANFSGAAAVNLTFTAGTNTPQNINLGCTSTAAAQTTNLQCNEIRQGNAPVVDGNGATFMRFWVLNCPAGNPPVGPSITYNPAAGASAGTGGPVNFTGVTTPGTTGTGLITATPSGGSGGGTTTVGAFSFTGGTPGAFTVTSAATLTFTAGVNTAQNITMTCLSTAVAQTSNLQATETIAGGATSTRFWVVNCPAGVAAPVGPSLSFNPAAGASAGTGGPVNFTGVTTAGSTGIGDIAVTPSGGVNSGTTTLNNCSFSGAGAGSFAGAGAVNLTFTAGNNAVQNIGLTCIAGAAPITANFQCTQTVTGGATSTAFFVVVCPAGTLAAAVPVPALGAEMRLLLAALMLLIGFAAVGSRMRE